MCLQIVADVCLVIFDDGDSGIGEIGEVTGCANAAPNVLQTFPIDSRAPVYITSRLASKHASCYHIGIVGSNGAISAESVARFARIVRLRFQIHALSVSFLLLWRECIIDLYPVEQSDLFIASQEEKFHNVILINWDERRENQNLTFRQSCYFLSIQK